LIGWNGASEMPRPKETAVLVAGGVRFEDWLSVWVQHRYSEPFAMFQFSAAERDKLPEHWQALQFKPSDPCSIELGGQLAINGYITTRQVAFDGRNHAVQLQGKSITHWAHHRPLCGNHRIFHRHRQ
jgi:prophage tail gpP-like protein